jgi:hypothetical protein
MPEKVRENFQPECPKKSGNFQAKHKNLTKKYKNGNVTDTDRKTLRAGSKFLLRETLQIARQVRITAIGEKTWQANYKHLIVQARKARTEWQNWPGP